MAGEVFLTSKKREKRSAGEVTAFLLTIFFSPHLYITLRYFILSVCVSCDSASEYKAKTEILLANVAQLVNILSKVNILNKLREVAL